ncbi:methylmalonyl-CoA mutase [Thermoanaerobaculum aquaticum]|uniref:Methylmalonyl-CoA mutase n=1 Tax=Thermoanaerobaculum aquaticum TaxID=1312852 RepID=A0A062XWP9_9BACT|nr:methylmalonyl-CoA mutase family protein [Thermoanaerobaculum aquaticum]KDA52895.1 methylmalonyl-CoA mutase [Thermoanaerobaculum aquaticum]
MDEDAYRRWLSRLSGDVTYREQVHTPSGLPVELTYGPWSVTGSYEEKLGLPGEYPFTRGIYPAGYRGKLWTMRQYAGFATAEESNRRYRFLLSQGQTGLSVAFDLPTQIGFDSDHPLALGEVGRVGVAIDTLADMETLLEGIPLDRVSLSMTINATASILLAMVLAVAKKQGVSWEKLSGTVQNDILKEYIARGTYRFPPRPSLRLVTDLMAFCHAQVPKWNTISISGYHIREAGATAVQEVAFTLANAREYVRQALAAGLAVDDFAPRLSFFFAAHNNFLEEVAKFRAARRLWAKTMKEEFGARDPRSWLLRFHTQTAGSTLTAQQPDNNVVRVTIQAMAAVCGGTQSLHTNAKDEALALPSEESALLALRTQQIIAYESGLADVVDPLGGAYVIEAWTDRIEAQASEYIGRIEAMGGALAAIERGFVQREIQDAAYRAQREIEEGSQVVVGVNRFQEGESKSPPVFRVNDEVQRAQVERLRAVKARRNEAEVKRTLEALENAAKTGENLMPPILAAVEAYATVGEIAGTLAAVFGEHREGGWS